MDNTFENLKRISQLESICTNPETINAINESLDGEEDSFGKFHTAKDAFAALYSSIEQEETNENNKR